MSNFHQLEVGGRGGETQIQVYANLSYLDSDSDLFIRHYNKTEFNICLGWVVRRPPLRHFVSLTYRGHINLGLKG